MALVDPLQPAPVLRPRLHALVLPVIDRPAAAPNRDPYALDRDAGLHQPLYDFLGIHSRILTQRERFFNGYFLPSDCCIGFHFSPRKYTRSAPSPERTRRAFPPRIARGSTYISPEIFHLRFGAAPSDAPCRAECRRSLSASPTLARVQIG